MNIYLKKSNALFVIKGIEQSKGKIFLSPYFSISLVFLSLKFYNFL